MIFWVVMRCVYFRKFSYFLLFKIFKIEFDEFEKVMVKA
jgi:hypothetical protein